MRPQVVLVLVLFALCGLTAAWLARGTDHVPMARLVPALPGPDGPQPSTPLPAPASPGAAGFDLPPPTEPTRDRAAAGTAQLVVRLRLTQGQPLPGVSVAAAAEAGPADAPWQAEQRTDAQGETAFEVPCHGQRRASLSVLGTTAEQATVLQPGQRTVLEMPVAVRALVRGVVTTHDGQPVAGAALCFHFLHDGALADAPYGSLPLGDTGPDGRFQVPLPGPGHLWAWRADLAPSACIYVPGSQGNQPPSEVELHFVLLSQGAVAAGQVVDSFGKGVPMAEVMLLAEPEERTRNLRAPAMQVRADREGRFAIGPATPGPRRYVAAAAGFARTMGAVALPAEERIELRIELAAEAVVVGTVRDAEGRPVAGATLTATLIGTDQTTAARSSADGSFRLDGLAAGHHRLVAAVANGARSLSATAELALTAGAEQTWNPQLAAAAPGLLGQLLDRDQQPLMGWTVVCQPKEGAPQGARTGPDGRFALQPCGGSVVLLAFAPDTAAGNLPDGVLELPTPPRGRVRFVVDRMRPRSSIAGRIVDTGNQPLAATVLLVHRELQRSVRGSADAQGRFEFASVPAGTCAVLVEHPGHVRGGHPDFAFEGLAPFELPPLVLGAGSAMFGSVVGPDGQAPAELELFVLTEQGRIDANYGGGNYRIDGLPAGRLRLQVQGAAVAAATFELELPAGAEQQRDIVLQRGVCRPFTLEAPAAAGDALTLALRVPGREQQWLAQARRRGTEAVAFTAWLAPGSYEAIAWGRAGYEARTTVVFAAGDDSPVVLRIAAR